MSQTFGHIPIVIGAGFGYIFFNDYGTIPAILAACLLAAGFVAFWSYSPMPNANYGRDRGRYWGWDKPKKTPLEEAYDRRKRCSDYVALGARGNP